VVLEDFKSFSWASSASGVGSIPTRSRHLLAVALCGATFLAAGAHRSHAQSPPADTTRSELPLVRSIGREGAPARDTTAADTTAADTTRTATPAPAAPPAPRLAWGAGRDAPWRVMMRSALVPGWGQLYNRQWIKAGIVIAAEGGLVATAVVYRIKANKESDPVFYADYDNTSRAALWYGAGVVLLSMIDAYVDAHLYRFADQFPPIHVRLEPAPGDPVPGDPRVTASLRVGF
jgi:uncharacterized protein DUF5683